VTAKGGFFLWGKGMGWFRAAVSENFANGKDEQQAKQQDLAPTPVHERKRSPSTVGWQGVKRFRKVRLDVSNDDFDQLLDVQILRLR